MHNLLFNSVLVLALGLVCIGCGGAEGDSSTADASATADAMNAADASLRPPNASLRTTLIRQDVFREDGAFARGGTARIRFYTPEELPSDDRVRVEFGANEFCTFESGTEYPDLLPGDIEWPSSTNLATGSATFVLDSAPGPVVWENNGPGFVRDQPAPVMIDGFTHNSFFDPAYLPAGSGLTMSVAAGASVGDMEVASTFPQSFVVSSPDLAAGGDVIDIAVPMTLTWSPAQSETSMVVIVKDTFSFIKCELVDDGSASIPVEAMGLLTANQFSTLTVQFWRELRLTTQVIDSRDQAIDVSLTTRHVQIARFDGADSSGQ